MYVVNEGAIYRNNDGGHLVEITDVEDAWGAHDPDNCSIRFETLDDGEHYSVFRDSFESGYSKVADSLAELDEADR